LYTQKHKVQNYNILYGAMLQYQRQHGLFPEIQDGKDPCTDAKASSPEVEIHDYSEGADRPVHRFVRGCINHILEDTRGMNKPICSKTAPAEHGMCPLCEVKSVRCKNNKSAAYLCAVCHLASAGYNYLHSIRIYIYIYLHFFFF
jgi:hypothetical protein